MKEEDYSKSIEVFSGSPWEAEIIKGLLESNDIRCVIKDGIMGTLAPYIAPAVSVLVTEDEYESATELIRSRATFDSWYAFDSNNMNKPVYGQQCISKRYCLSWQVWKTS